MTVYSLWFGWSTLFLVDVYKISQTEANLRYVWLPPIFATLGGLCGGWLARHFIRQGLEPLHARVRIALMASIAVLPTALTPLMPTPGTGHRSHLPQPVRHHRAERQLLHHSH